MTLHARPRSPFEFAVLLPYRLGYHPRRSVVVVAMHGRTAGVVQRHDVSDDRDHCEVAAARALEVLERDGADAILLFGFEDAPWHCDFGGHREMGAVRIPSTVVATYALPDGPWEYLRAELTSREPFPARR